MFLQRTGRVAMVLAAVGFALCACAQTESLPQSKSVITPNKALATPVGGLERTNAIFDIVQVSGQPFSEAIKVKIGSASQETNATQLTVLNESPIEQGDLLMATLWMRGSAGSKPARAELMFEKATDPWTKSVIHPLRSGKDASAWKKFVVPFTSAGKYQTGEAMLSIRLAFGPQTVELGGIQLENFGKNLTLEALYARLYSGKGAPTTLTVDPKVRKQVLAGLGGNFCQPRYGKTEPMDRVGTKVLDSLNVAYARIGIPLNFWNPEPGVYKDEAQAKASFEAMKILKNRGIGIIASVWEGPQWLQGGQVEQSGRTLPRDKWATCIESLGQYLVTAKVKYGVEPAYLSFNEPDYGVNFKFFPAEKADFFRQAIKAWEAKGIKIKFLIGDTANGISLAPYVEHFMAQKDLLPHLGPIAFHCWDSLTAPDEAYEGIAELGRKHKKEIWCTEAGWDAQLWQKPNPWVSWENALGNARAYARTFRLTGSSRLDYWTYQDNYPLLNNETGVEYPVFDVMKAMSEFFAAGSTVVQSESDEEGLEHVAVAGPKGVGVMIANPKWATKVKIRGLGVGKKFTVTVMGDGEESSSAVSAVSGEVEVVIPARSVVFVTP